MKKQKEITILLTSAGGLTGIFLCKHFKKTSNYKIVAVDMSSVNPLLQWVDVFYTTPSVKDKAFISEIKRILSDEKVDIIIPLTSYDIDYFSQTHVKKELHNIGMLLMDYADHSILSNKKTCYKYLKEIGIATPEIFESIEEANYPCILKPQIGSGSKGIVKIDNINDYKYWSQKVNDYLLVQYLEGKEYTVDCLFDINGKCFGANVRERVKTTSGGATVTRNDYTINIDDLIKKLETTKKIKGPVNFQFKQLSNGELCIFDFNTRFASGGLPLTVKSGFDIPNKLIQLIRNDNVDSWHPKLSENGLVMIRYYEEYFFNMI